jgi:hypothetical protein
MLASSFAASSFVPLTVAVVVRVVSGLAGFVGMVVRVVVMAMTTVSGERIEPVGDACHDHHDGEHGAHQNLGAVVGAEEQVHL